MGVLALLYYLDGNGVVPWVLLACTFHELAHWSVIRALGGRVVLLRLSCAGAEMRLSAAHPLSPGGMLLAAVAGPASNLAIAWFSVQLVHWEEKLYFFAGLNLGLACFNLLPASWLDGGKAVEALLVRMGRKELGGRLVELGSDITAGFLLAAGLILLWQTEGRNFTLLIAGLWMAAAARRERRTAFL